MDYYKKAKEKLYSVATLRRRLKNYEAAYDREIRRSGPSGIAPIDLSKPVVKSSRAEDNFESADKIAYYKSKIEQTAEEIDDILSVVKQLPEEYRKVVEECFFKRGSDQNRVEMWKIAQKFHIAESSLYRIRNKAIRMFADIFPW